MARSESDWLGLGVKVFIGFVVIVLILVLVPIGMINVAPNEVAVEIDKVGHKVIQEPHGVGYYFYNKWSTDYVPYKISSRSYPADGSDAEQDVVKTSDGQNVNVKIMIIYSLNATQVPALHQEIGPDYEAQIILPQLRSEARLAISNYTAEDIYTGKARDEMQSQIRDRMISSMKAYPAINIHDALIKGFSFSPQFEAAIEQKQLQSQQVEINKNKTLAQMQMAQQQQAEASGAKLQAIQQAEGEAQAVRLNADAKRYALEQEAAGNLAKYKAEAEGKKLAAEALGGGQYVVALKFAEMLSPDLKIYATVPAGNTNIMDLTGVLKGLKQEETKQ
jgi:regulator of protease activity HflC (stomatin/prohibitin superfamily)